jgi:hypothetical protein
MVELTSRLPGSVPFSFITTNTCAQALFSGCFSHFGVCRQALPRTVAPSLHLWGGQLSIVCFISGTRLTIPHRPQSNGPYSTPVEKYGLIYPTLRLLWQ